jgi:hypothetical protein
MESLLRRQNVSHTPFSYATSFSNDDTNSLKFLKRTIRGLIEPVHFAGLQQVSSVPEETARIPDL